VLVLDEPTEGIDPDAAQRIMAMAGGRIEASGTHAELLTASAAYRQGFAPSG
jgi:ABC-type transport system involved in cytochrome bd biosynthesis fused ATPase/permease subunit